MMKKVKTSNFDTRLCHILHWVEHFIMADLTKLENKVLYKPTRDQFCIANNAVKKHVFDPLLLMNDTVEIQLKYTTCFPQTYHISNHHFGRYFITLSHLLK